MILTMTQLVKALPDTGPIAEHLVTALNDAAGRFSINTPSRLAAFLAQAAHESRNFTVLKENLNYSVEALLSTFSRERISKADAQRYGRSGTQKANQTAIANLIYGGAWGARNLGNTQPNDGSKFIGRGPLQITGRSNYEAVGKALGINLADNPELLEQVKYGVPAAGWFWNSRNLNSYADKGDINSISSIINTGKPGNVALGQQERADIYKRALKVLTAG